jgi:hypothetical protein
MSEACILPIGEAGGFLGDASQELHGFYAEGEPFAVLALVDVEAGEFADAIEAVADGVAVGEEVARGLDRSRRRCRGR